MADKKETASKPNNNVVNMAKKKASPKKAAVKKTTAKKAAPSARPQASKKSAAPNKTFTSTNPLEDIMMKNNAQFDKMAQDAADFNRQSLEAMSQSYGIFAKGYESLMRTTMELSQSAAEKQATFAKEAMSCSSMNELTDMQSKVAQASFEDFMSSATKLSEISTKVLTESAEPLNAQISKTMQSMKKAA